jgi:hypothetical protein
MTNIVHKKNSGYRMYPPANYLRKQALIYKTPDEMRHLIRASERDLCGLRLLFFQNLRKSRSPKIQIDSGS